jgi:hypothetical protein
MVVSGLAVTMFGTGASSLLGRKMIGLTVKGFGKVPVASPLGNSRGRSGTLRPRHPGLHLLRTCSFSPLVHLPDPAGVEPEGCG